MKLTSMILVCFALLSCTTQGHRDPSALGSATTQKSSTACYEKPSISAFSKQKATQQNFPMGLTIDFHNQLFILDGEECSAEITTNIQGATYCQVCRDKPGNLIKLAELRYNGEFTERDQPTLNSLATNKSYFIKCGSLSPVGLVIGFRDRGYDVKIPCIEQGVFEDNDPQESAL